MKITPELIKKYYAGHCNKLEHKAIESWLKSSESEMSFPSDLVVKKAEQEIWKSLSSDIQTTNRWARISTMKKGIGLVAASIALLIGFVIFQNINKQSIITYKTLAGEFETVKLPDGTLVYLNVGSILEIPKAFTNKTRKVFLVGEAYFEVAKDTLKPFIIETKNTKTEVLGTKFNLSAYPSEATSLTLNEGKVAFSTNNPNKKERLIIKPNEQVILDEGKLKKMVVNPERYKGWINNDLFLEGSVSHVFQKLERHFDTKIKISNAS